MKLRANAKINLSLRVFEKRLDGFHEIESVMQSVSLCDYVTLTPLPSGIEVICNDPKVPPGMDNVAHRAAEAYLSSSTLEPEKGVRIHIEKHVPVAAGLAGGSADAAAVLYGLNQMSNTPMSGPELLELGARVGSDVPFCLKGGTCLVKGRGDLVEQVTPWPKTYFIVVCPNFQVSTPWAYERFDQMHLEVSGKIKNDLEPVVVAEHEVVTEIKEKLVELGCSESQMSGSGPSVFGTVRHKTEAEEIFEKVKEEYPRTFLVETVDQGVSEA